jgi:hypothetical protein
MRSLCFVFVALLAGCTYGNVGPAAATVTVPTAAAAPAHPPPCESDFLERAMSLRDLVTSLGDSSSSAQIPTILRQVEADLSTYSQIAAGRDPSSADQIQQMQDAAWMQSGATQAYVIIRQFSAALSASPITTDAQKISADITGGHHDEVIRDLRGFLHDINVVVAPINELVGYRSPDGGAPGPETGAGAVMRYLGPVLATINKAKSGVSAFLDPATISNAGTCPR